MLSRVADSILWMARYMERTNGLLRLTRTQYISSQDEIKSFSWKPVLTVYGDLSEHEVSQVANNSTKALNCLLLEKNNFSSALNNITSARENARAIQDHLTKEVWQCINEFYHLIKETHIQYLLQFGDPVTALDLLMRHGMMYYGVVDTTMSRGEGYNYLTIGKFLERGIQTIDIVLIKLNEMLFEEQISDAPGWRYMLYSITGYEMYLKNQRGNLKPDAVLQMVIYHMHFPHSILYCLHQVNRYAERLHPDTVPEQYEQLEFVIGRVMNNVKYSTVMYENETELKKFLLETRANFFEIANAFKRLYFANT